MLSDKGFAVTLPPDEDGEEREVVYKQKAYERKFFSEETNLSFIRCFFENAKRDPVTGEIGKTLFFAVSRAHATKLVRLLNEEAARLYPAQYGAGSDFAVQVTSDIPGAQQMTVDFANNNLNGKSRWRSDDFRDYDTSRTRVCVTVGMMTTGYDCEDLLNVALARPIFSPGDFIQIKGRGTRPHNFLEDLFDDAIRAGVTHPRKTTFKLFDFFANCEYFETDFDYDEVLKLPVSRGPAVNPPLPPTPPPPGVDTYEHLGRDIIESVTEQAVGFDGMKIDRMFFERFEDAVRDDPVVAAGVEAGQWDRVIDYVNREIFDKPEEYYNLDKLRKAAAVDRRLGLREILEKIFGRITAFKSKDELLEEEFAKFVSLHVPAPPRRAARRPSLLQGLHHPPRHPRDRRTPPIRRTGDEPRLHHAGLPRRPRRLPPNRPGIHQGLRHPEPVRGVRTLCLTPTPDAASTPPATSLWARSPTPRAKQYQEVKNRYYGNRSRYQYLLDKYFGRDIAIHVDAIMESKFPETTQEECDEIGSFPEDLVSYQEEWTAEVSQAPLAEPDGYKWKMMKKCGMDIMPYIEEIQRRNVPKF
jgi:hypothetical protein